MGTFQSMPIPANNNYTHGLMNLDNIESKIDVTEFYKLRIYQVMVSSFLASKMFFGGYGCGYGPSHHRGDLDGINNALDYIKSLNMNALWITPIFDSNYSYKGKRLQSTGYFCNDYFKVDKHFGGDQAFKRLVDACHERGIYVILDVAFGHNGKVKKNSPSGLKPTDEVAKFPESIDFCLEVIQYWTENFEVDGWRLDQCYQLNQDGHNYMHDIRVFFEKLCTKRREEGKKWGTLGYIVGEHWAGVDEIRETTYKDDGLLSAFDFPARYSLVASIAQCEDGTTGGVDRLSYVFNTPQNKGYYDNSIPNMFIGNHDLWRLGNLIRSRHKSDEGSKLYWDIHKLAFSVLAAYSGPITVYYGEEYGDITFNWFGDNTCGKYVASDNCSRTNGNISKFDSRQRDLIQYVKNLMKFRNDNPSLFRGRDSVTIQGDILVNYKYDDETGNKVITMFNIGQNESTVNYMCDHKEIMNIMNPKEKYQVSNNGTFDVTLKRMEAAYFTVVA